MTLSILRVHSLLCFENYGRDRFFGSLIRGSDDEVTNF